MNGRLDLKSKGNDFAIPHKNGRDGEERKQARKRDLRNGSPSLLTPQYNEISSYTERISTGSVALIKVWAW
jgi:hypothetical protein